MPLIHLKTKRLEYKFEVTQKYSIIRGDSGTGKTSLLDVVNLYSLDKYSVECPGYAKLAAIPTNAAPEYLKQYDNAVLFIDEDNVLLHTKKIASIFRESHNYFVIITRTIKLDYLPISLDSIFDMKASGRFHTLVQHFSIENETILKSSLMICEDSRSGLKFMREVFDAKQIKIIAADAGNVGTTAGKSKIAATVKLYYENGAREMCLVFDSSAIGTNFDTIENVIKMHPGLQVSFIGWSSFEQYILESPMSQIDVGVAGCDWESQEQLATYRFKQIFENYNKSSLPFCLRRNRCTDNCTKATGCFYRRKSFEELIYWKVRELYELYEES